MSYQILKYVVLLVVFFHIGAAYAKESSSKEEAKKEEEAPKEGEAAAAGGEETEAQKKQMSEATELQAKVQALQAKVKNKQEMINKLIEEKHHTKNAAQAKEIIEQMKTEHKELTKIAEEYEQNRNLLRYRYPEKGFKGGRSYERIEVKPLDQMENQLSVDAKLKKTLNTVRMQYGEAHQNGKKNKKSKEGEAPSLTEPIVIQK